MNAGVVPRCTCYFQYQRPGQVHKYLSLSTRSYEYKVDFRPEKGGRNCAFGNTKKEEKNPHDAQSRGERMTCTHGITSELHTYYLDRKLYVLM